MEKKFVWIKNQDAGYNRKNEGYYITESEISLVAAVNPCDVRTWSNVPGNKEIKLPEIIINSDGDEMSFRTLDYYEKVKYLDKLVGNEGEDCNDDDGVPAINCLAFDYDCNEFFSPADLDTYKQYKYWDGSNWKVIELNPDYDTEYEIELKDESSYNLDVWDGNNSTWGGRFEHAYLKKIAKVDNEESNSVLWVSWSQWQGSVDMAEIMTVDELFERLTEEEHPEIEEIKSWLEITE